ncbi:MAG: hypothetical protein B6242_11995 [Anaerolineaceae bacterium 4572_78]|nr:MAG: hypothetical protein B6242_11995 [Anaerolineaceae bacterium 4572_78]
MNKVVYGHTLGLFNAKTKNMAWDIFRHDFQSCGRTMERKSLLFHVKASFDAQFILSKNSIEQPYTLSLLYSCLV